MLETSKDLLNIVIAFCILWFTVFVCWFIYYMVMIIRRVADTTEQIAKMTANINEFFVEAKKRLKKATSYLPLVVEGIKDVTDYIKEKKGSSKKPSPRHSTQKKTSRAK